MADKSDPKSLKRTRGGRERLLAVAGDLFNTHSLAGTSLQMIADRLGVTKPAIYHHFRSRDDIVVALMEPVIADATRAIRQFRRLPPQARPQAARQFYTDFVVTHRRVIHMVFFDLGSMPGSLPAQVDDLADGVSQALGGGSDADSRAVGSTLVYGVAALVARCPDLSDADLRRSVVLVFQALMPATAGIPSVTDPQETR